MARLTIYKDNVVETTAVSNLFIDNYMADANDAQIKVYLYLLRMMHAHLATSISDMADKFNHTEKDVLRALKYWEKKQLLDLDYDDAKNLVGIHIHELSSHVIGEPIPAKSFASSPVHGTIDFTTVPPVKVEDCLGTAVPGKPENHPGTPASVKPEPDYTKPAYSADQLREFKQRQETSQLLFIAESYIGKPLTPSEMKTILYFTDVLHFSDDLIDYLLQYCVDKGKKDFKYIEKVAVNWAEQGISTPKQAQSQAYLYDKNVYAVMRELGKNSSPTPREASYITRWIQEYGFENDVIFEACARTVMATDKNRIEYADRILSSWHAQNVQHKSDISQLDENYRQRRRAASGSAATPKTTANRFNQFTQNTYDFDALEKELLSNQ